MHREELDGIVHREELDAARCAVLQACRITAFVFDQLVARTGEFAITKDDQSPVTVADYASQAVINSYLLDRFPHCRIAAEEDSSLLASSSSLQNEILCLVRQHTPDSKIDSTESLLKAIDAGNYAGGVGEDFWTLDPIDGTKGFLRGGQYAVSLAFISQGRPVLGVLGCPNLQGGIMLDTVRNSGIITKHALSDTSKKTMVESCRQKNQSWQDLVFCESVEPGHSSHQNQESIAKRLGVTKPAVRMDSQAKYASLVLGDADIYLRIPVRASYEEKIWDHAAGTVLVEEAGGRVGDIDGRPLDFSFGRTLKHNRGVIAVCDAWMWDRVTETVKETLQDATC